jgi:hypothetical protein
MYNHSNQSSTSTNSGRRISTNNPFRSALLQEERARERNNSISVSPNIDEAQYKKWLNQRIEEEQADARRNSFNSNDEYDFYENDDANSFTEGDEYEHVSRPPSSSRPNNFRTTSESSIRRDSYNPFAPYTRSERSNSGTPVQTPVRTSFSTIIKETVPSSDFVAPPSYDEVVGRKYGKNEYPKDEKNPFPDANNGSPRRAQTVSVRRPAPPPPTKSSSRLNPESMTNTTTTRILSDGRVRSKSTGEPFTSKDENHHNKSHGSSRAHDGQRSRHHHHHSHRTHDDDKERDPDRPRRSKTSRRKKFVQERSKNLDTIDKLDVTGFFGGGKFHHDGPFDACTPQRNKDTKAAPVAAFPVDGPNNSIKGMAPLDSKNAQYDMVFGIDKANDYDSEYAPTKPRSNSASDLLIRGYTNGTIVERADSADLESLAPKKQGITQVNAGSTEKLYGDTTLGLGSSTFMDGAPAYGATVTEPRDGGLSRKKTLLGRMKTIVRK